MIVFYLTNRNMCIKQSKIKFELLFPRELFGWNYGHYSDCGSAVIDKVLFWATIKALYSSCARFTNVFEDFDMVTQTSMKL